MKILEIKNLRETDKFKYATVVIDTGRRFFYRHKIEREVAKTKYSNHWVFTDTGENAPVGVQVLYDRSIISSIQEGRRQQLVADIQEDIKKGRLRKLNNI